MDTKLFSNDNVAQRDGIVYNKDGSNNSLPVAMNPGEPKADDPGPATFTPPVHDSGPRRVPYAGS